MGYHIRQIKKGVYGTHTKIREELDELEDALEQGNQIMASCELSDIYGALRAFATVFGLSMKDLEIMADATERAFHDGTRK